MIFLVVEGEARRLDPERAGDHIDALYRTARAMCGDSSTAEDLVQETYVKVLSRPRLLRRDDDLGYLIKALRNTWYSHLRSERVRREQASPGEHDPDAIAASTTHRDPQASLEASEVLDALADLPEPYREVVAAVDVAGLSYSEAASALGVKEGTVMSRLYRGRERVAEALTG